jgi:hypothetical protein
LRKGDERCGQDGEKSEELHGERETCASAKDSEKVKMRYI